MATQTTQAATQTLRQALKREFLFLDSCVETDGELSETRLHKNLRFEKTEEDPLNEDQVFEVVERYCLGRGFRKGKYRGNGAGYAYKMADGSLLHIVISVDPTLVQISIFPN